MSNHNEINSIINNINSIECRKNQLIQDFKSTKPRIGTGWLSVDKVLCGGLANELYIIGAETSTGKSTLFMSLAQNCAKQGVNVLYFSLEMSDEEFVARGISSISFVSNSNDRRKTKVTTGDILYYKYDEICSDFTKIKYDTYSEYAEEYFRTYGNHLYIVEGGINGLRAKDIANICTSFKQSHPDDRIVVFVDYLQLLKADGDDRSQTDRKTKMDVSVATLKTLASHVGMPVLTISSVSRQKYGDKVSTSSFKESGDTEYTGGVLIGWNWVGVTDTADTERIRDEKELCIHRGYRLMSFEVLKFRNAARDNAVSLVYFPAYNYIVDTYGWNLDAWGENPIDISKEASADGQKRQRF